MAPVLSTQGVVVMGQWSQRLLNHSLPGGLLLCGLENCFSQLSGARVPLASPRILNPTMATDPFLFKLMHSLVCN